MNPMPITKRDLDSYAKSVPFLVVVVYANWCPHCREMKRRLGTKMQNHEKLIFLEDNDIADDLKDHYPHVRIYENGTERDSDLDYIYKLLQV
jgi:thiol-disulfide isomerase/thioredoxin